VAAFALAAAAAVAQQVDAKLVDLARSGKPEEIRAALKTGASLGERNRSHLTPLIAAAESNPDPDVVRLLLASGSLLDEDNGSGYTAMIAAASRNRNPEVLKALIAAGGRVNSGTPPGYTPLMAAAGDKNTEAVRTLLAAGADIRARTTRGWTAMTYAVWSPPLTTRAMSDASAVIVAMLLGAGATIDEGGTDVPATLSMAATKSANPEVIRLILAAGAKVEGSGASTPLMDAARWNGTAGVFDALLEAGAKIDARDASGMTALMYAAGTNTPQIVALLLDAGADPSLKAGDGSTAYEAALRNRLLQGKPELQRLRAGSR
jgi:ankyrin repeat protein